MEIFPEEKRQWEINAYNDLGFYIIKGSDSLYETGCGWKNERREATSIESTLWSRFASKTPEIIPTIQVNNSVVLDHGSFQSFGIKTKEMCVWLENKYEMSIFACHEDYRGEKIWYHYYTFMKEFRMPEDHERED